MAFQVQPPARSSLLRGLPAASAAWLASSSALPLAVAQGAPLEGAFWCLGQFVVELVVVEALIVAHALARGRRFAELASLFASLVRVNASIFSLGCLVGIVHRILTAGTAAAAASAALSPDAALPLAALHCAFALLWLLRSDRPRGHEQRGEADGPLPVYRIPRVNKKTRRPVRHLPGNHEVFTGVITHFLPKREIGFLRPETGDFVEDLYFKVTALSMELQLLGKGMEGRRVDFVVVYRTFERAHVRAAVPHVGE